MVVSHAKQRGCRLRSSQQPWTHFSLFWSTLGAFVRDAARQFQMCQRVLDPAPTAAALAALLQGGRQRRRECGACCRFQLLTVSGHCRSTRCAKVYTLALLVSMQSHNERSRGRIVPEGSHVCFRCALRAFCCHPFAKQVWCMQSNPWQPALHPELGPSHACCPARAHPSP